MWDDLSEILFQSFFLQEALTSSSGMGRDVHCLNPAFPLPTKASPNLQGAMKDDSEEAVVACSMPQPNGMIKNKL